ncbi:MAG: hypothetical protein AAFU78_21750 [Cyanobacteria bacterium J06633_2]
MPSPIIPIYSRRINRREIFVGAEEDEPWGLIWDLFDFSKKNWKDLARAVFADDTIFPKPCRIERSILRAAPRPTIGGKRKDRAVRGVVEGLEHTFGRQPEKAAELSRITFEIFSASFKSNLLALALLRNLRLVRYSDASRFSTSLCRSYLDVVGSDQTSFIHQTISQAVSVLTQGAEQLDFESRYDTMRSDLELIRGALISTLQAEIQEKWALSEKIWRATPYKIFALLPLFQMRRKDHSANHQNRLCMVCCRVDKDVSNGIN